MGLEYGSKMKSAERRKSRRLKVPVKIKYQLLPKRKLVEEIFTKDISGGGLKISTSYALKKGDRLKTLIYFPADARPVTAYSRVVWQKKVSGRRGKSFDIGMKHLKIASGDKDRFVFLFCEMMINYFIFGKVRNFGIVKAIHEKSQGKT